MTKYILVLPLVCGATLARAAGVADPGSIAVEPKFKPLAREVVRQQALDWLASRQPDHLLTWIGALTAALAVSGVVLLAADGIRRVLGTQMVAAIEKLMGLVLTAVAVEMILAGLKRYFIGDL